MEKKPIKVKIAIKPELSLKVVEEDIDEFSPLKDNAIE
jgi:hypothetical protein